MNYSALKKTAQRLSDQASFVVEIVDNDEYEQALELMDELIDDYDNHLVLIELLSKLSIMISLYTYTVMFLRYQKHVTAVVDRNR